MNRKDEITLELHKLIISSDEVEAESDGRISAYLMERSARYGNQLGRMRKKLINFEMIQDLFSSDYILVFECEGWM